MSRSFFISSLKPPAEIYLSDYRIDVDDYAHHLQIAYPFAKIYDPKLWGSTYLLRWALDDLDRLGMDGGLQGDSITVSFSARQYWNTKDYILWHRRYIPEDVPLYLFNEEMDMLLLTYQTTKAEITAFTRILVG